MNKLLDLVCHHVLRYLFDRVEKRAVLKVCSFMFSSFFFFFFSFSFRVGKTWSVLVHKRPMFYLINMERFKAKTPSVLLHKHPVLFWNIELFNRVEKGHVIFLPVFFENSKLEEEQEGQEEFLIFFYSYKTLEDSNSQSIRTRSCT